MLFLVILVLNVCVLPRGCAKWLSMPPRTSRPDGSTLKKNPETSPTGGEGGTRSLGLANANYYIQNGKTTKPYHVAQGTILKILK